MTHHQPDHCPFLNRADDRCADHFKLDQLTEAFRSCFGEYNRCPVYLQMFLERRVKRLVAAGKEPLDDLASRLVQVTVPRRKSVGNGSRIAA
jgi:hypothetical protein